MKTYWNFTDAYVDLLKTVYTEPEHEAAPRGMKVKERLGHSFRIVDVKNRIPYVNERDFSITYMIAELVWYLSANDSTEWISRYSAFWRNISDDGTTANSAYGARIFKPHARIAESVDPIWTQWQYVINELRDDPDSRRAVIHIRSPQDSILAKKDVPCTLALQFFIRDGALHQVASMRSSDLVLGIAYDIPAFTMFQELMALELGVPTGTYTHISNSLHIYERHYEMVEKIIAAPPALIFPPAMPSLPGKPPCDALNAAEASIVASTSRDEILNVLKTLDVLGLTDDYWRDWVRILAWHRAGKLGDVELQRTIMDSVTFKGYKFFKK